MMRFKKFLRSIHPPELDELFLTDDGTAGQCFSEGKWLDGRFKENIRIGRATHMLSGDAHAHAHVYGRKGKLIGVLNFDGTRSHDNGESFRLHQTDAEALRLRGFQVPKNNIVEWILFDVVPDGVLFG